MNWGSNSGEEKRFLAYGLAIGILVGLIIAMGFFVLFNLVPADSLASSGRNGSTILQPLPADSYSATVDIVAVQAQGERGITNQAEVEIRPGRGRVLFSLNPFIEPDTQQSAEIAKRVTEAVTGKKLDNFDLIYTINSPAQLVGGPSAGAAFAIATIAAVERQQINPEVLMTGTIEPDGRIGQIGGVLEKAEAVARAGKKIFLVPRGQSRLSYYEPVRTIEQRGPVIIERVSYVTKQLDLKTYAREEWGLEVREVSTIREAAEYMFV